MTDEQKAELARLAREALEAEDKWSAADKETDRLLNESLTADRLLAEAMSKAELEHIVVGQLMLSLDGDGIDTRRKRLLVIP